MIFDDFIKFTSNDGNNMGINLGCIMFVYSTPMGLRFVMTNGDIFEMTPDKFPPSIINTLKERYFGANEVYNKMV